jgi:DNA polymerase/3'-5' exonuclease PolX
VTAVAGVESVDDFVVALEQGPVPALKGFGQKTAEKLRRSMADFRKHVGRALMS